MSDSRRSWRGWAVACVVFAGCGDPPHYETVESPETMSNAGAASEKPAHSERVAGRDAKAKPKKPSKPRPPEPVKESSAVDEAADAGADGQGGDAVSTMEPVPTAESVAGTADAASCQSFTTAQKGMCRGYYCGIDMKTLAAVVDPAARCSNAEYFCSGNTLPVGFACKAAVKDEMPLAPEATLRPEIETCVLKGELIEGTVTSNCIDCFLDAVDCGTKPDTCLLACLDGSSLECDECMKANNCYDGMYECAGLPTPF